ncbi:MAG: preprotein translocase subunit SecG [Gammaproteobacteria bacterium]|nr:preprotein translocase subunit SecG [Gammaproteobacteria bacterium]NIR82814.1 preprotein translocase subunit SecG [Gammaproteobacteria bacterium]NIR89923.1 preprotein translocase subunit SecG [Gammaproteobacteria bacterium]NIU03972.1 preprotein translocase subunit SecG [Gammaproteobacteria bacterium]NIV51292.1 preprotein translocase subunit SecG [Gammaproteobacteria bacterium]
MYAAIIGIHVLVALGVIGFVLLQHGRGADAGAAFGAGASGSVFGSRGPATFLSRATAVLAAIFFFTSLSLAWMSGRQVESESVMERVQSAPESPPVPGEPSDLPQAPAPSSAPSDVPEVPPAQEGG